MSRQSASRIGTSLVEWISVLTPDWVRALFLGQPMAQQMTVRADGRSSGRGDVPVGVLTGEVPGAEPRQWRTVDVIVPAELFLKRTIRVPKRARGKLYQTALLDLRQRTPFGPEDVWWQLDRPTERENQIDVTQWVVKRSEVEDWRQSMARHGYRLRRIFVHGAQSETPIANFTDQLAPWAKQVRWFNGAVAGVALAAALAGSLYPGWLAQRQAQGLEAELQGLRVEAVAIRQEVEVSRGRDAARAAFLDTVLRRPLLVDTLRELTVALPDDVWVANLNFSPDRAVISGETGASAADLVLQLGARPRMGNPRLSGPVQRTAAGAERFEITVDLSGSG